MRLVISLFCILFIFRVNVSAQSPILIPPTILDGPTKVSTLDLLNVIVQNFDPLSQHLLSVGIRYAPICESNQNIVSSLNLSDVQLDNFGKIKSEYLASYDGLWLYSDDAFQDYIIHTGFLPPGCYQVCYDFTDKIESVTTVSCIDFKLDSDIPFYLLTPFDESIVNDQYPIFSWTPYGVMSMSDYTYKLSLVEYYNGQSKVDAILFNSLKLFEEKIEDAFIQYPASASPLERCRQYVWRVDVGQGDYIVKSSEIWQFKTSCDDVFTPEVQNAKYHILSDDRDNIPFNIVGDTLRFILNQPYQILENYIVSIESLNTNNIVEVRPEMIVEGNDDTEKFNLLVGENYCLIDIKSLGFIPGDQYLLKAGNQKDIQYLHFKYFKE